MDIREANLMLKSLEAIIKQLDVPLQLANECGDENLRMEVAKFCERIVIDIDYTIRSDLLKKFPELKRKDI